MYVRDFLGKDSQDLYNALASEPLMATEIMQAPCINEVIYKKYIDRVLVLDSKIKIFSVISDNEKIVGYAWLDHISHENCLANYRILIKKEYWGKGYSWQAQIYVLDYAFRMLGLQKVYWYVGRDNKRAISYFDKCNFSKMDGDIPPEIREQFSDIENKVWYAALEGDDYRNAAVNRGTVAGCKVVKIETIPTIEAGELSFFETGENVPFDIKRIYYITKAPEGIRRGFHAHKKLKQLLFCPYGKIQLVLENEMGREEITLSDPSIGVLIERPTWREMLWLQKDSVLCVAASEFYDPNDYIRSYSEFRELLKERHYL